MARPQGSSAVEMIDKVLEHYGADLTRVSLVGWRPVKCPFHDDRNASASVNLNLGGFRCHACGIHGDAIKLIQEREGLGFKDAVSKLEEISGESVPGVSRSASGSKPRRQPSRWRQKLFS